MSKREEEFDVAAKRVARTKRTADAQAQCEYDFTLGCEYGYQYTINKACEWLEQHAYLYVDDIDQLHESALIGDFRKCMED